MRAFGLAIIFVSASGATAETLTPLRCDVVEKCWGHENCEPSVAKFGVTFSPDQTIATFEFTAVDGDDDSAQIDMNGGPFELTASDGAPNDDLFFIGGFDENRWLSVRLTSPIRAELTEVWSHSLRYFKSICIEEETDT